MECRGFAPALKVAAALRAAAPLAAAAAARPGQPGPPLCGPRPLWPGRSAGVVKEVGSMILGCMV